MKLHTDHEVVEKPIFTALAGIGIHSVELNSEDVYRLLQLHERKPELVGEWLGAILCRFLPRKTNGERS